MDRGRGPVSGGEVRPDPTDHAALLQRIARVLEAHEYDKRQSGNWMRFFCHCGAKSFGSPREHREHVAEQIAHEFDRPAVTLEDDR